MPRRDQRLVHQNWRVQRFIGKASPHIAGLIGSRERLDDILTRLAAEFSGVTVVDLVATLQRPLGARDIGIGGAPAHEDDVSAFLTTFAERLSCAVIDAETDRTAPLASPERRVVADEQAALCGSQSPLPAASIPERS